MIDVIPTDYCRSEPLLRLTATGEPEFGQTFNGNLLTMASSNAGVPVPI
jgi:hypothetical protein